MCAHTILCHLCGEPCYNKCMHLTVLHLHESRLCASAQIATQHDVNLNYLICALLAGVVY